MRSVGLLTVIRFLIAACALCVTASFATDADDYLRRAAQRDVAMFDALDRDKDGQLTMEKFAAISTWKHASTISISIAMA